MLTCLPSPLDSLSPQIVFSGTCQSEVQSVMDNSANHRHDDASIEQLLVAPRKSTSENKASASASLPVTHDVEESEECALSPGSNDGSPDGLSNFLPVSSFLKAIQATSHAVHAVRECSHWIEYQLDENTWNLLKPRLEESVEGIRYAKSIK